MGLLDRRLHKAGVCASHGGATRVTEKLRTRRPTDGPRRDV